MFSRFKAIFLLTIKLFLTLVVVFLIVRVLEYALVCSRGTIDFSLAMFFERSVNLDSFFIYQWSGGILLVALFIAIFHQQIAEQIARFLAFILVIIHLILTGYFVISSSILSSSVLEFSATELLHIVGNEISTYSFLILIVIIGVAWLAYMFIYKTSKRIIFSKRMQRVFIGVYLLLGVFVLVNLRYSTKAIKYFDSSYAYLLGNSKETLFLQSFKNESTKTTPSDIARNTAIYSDNHPEFNFSDLAYPLIHDEQYANVLGEYFIKDSSIKPNVVLIISESLSASFSGKRCVTPRSLTPFIDSLAREGLSWNNFLANAERSHGVLTNVLASLPSGIGQRGFANMKVNLPKGMMYPEHQSSLSLLRDNGYTSSFYYGGWGYYDHAGNFLHINGIDHFITEDSFSKAQYTRKTGPISWGYNDMDLFHLARNLHHNQEKKTPFIDIYQTLSLHTPYNLVTAKYESKDYIKKRVAQLGIQDGEMDYIPSEILGTIFFSEDALRTFMKDALAKEEYENTIFIIVGDHGVNYPVSKRTLEKYHVPLVIYSKLLRKNGKFNGMCSHIDIAPSILALLEQNYGIQLPAEKHWLGQGLDTSSTFRNNKKIPLAVYGDNLARYISGNYIKYEDRILQFDSTLATTEVVDQEIIDRINSEFENYLFVNAYTCQEGKVWRE